VRVEVTLTGVCHCPRQIISSTARYAHSAVSANLPQDERGPQWKSRVYARERAVFMPAARIMHSYRYASPVIP